MVIDIDPDVEEFISSLEKQTIAKTLRTIDLLERFAFELGMPHSKKISGPIFELRIRGMQEVRIFYCFYQEKIHLLWGYVKKSQQLPKKELHKAIYKYQLLTD